MAPLPRRRREARPVQHLHRHQVQPARHRRRPRRGAQGEGACQTAQETRAPSSARSSRTDTSRTPRPRHRSSSHPRQAHGFNINFYLIGARLRLGHPLALVPWLDRAPPVRLRRPVHAALAVARHARLRVRPLHRSLGCVWATIAIQLDVARSTSRCAHFYPEGEQRPMAYADAGTDAEMEEMFERQAEQTYCFVTE